MNASAASVEDDAAAIALEALSGLPAAKRLAAAALYVQATRRLSREAALACVARVYRLRLGPSRGGWKKAVSEGRAILQFGLGERRLAEEVARLPAADMIAALEGAMRRVSLREVTRARATALAGGRGGRPMARPSAVYAAVRKLLDLAEGGDPAARAELSAIRDLMGAAQGHRAHRPAASR